MRGKLAAGLATVALFPCAALASVSDDLVFCSKLANAKERISCYDAAARIAAAASSHSAPNSQPILVTRQVADHAMAAPIAPTHNRFDGAFLAVGGGYGIANPRTVNPASILFSNTDQVSAQ